MRVLIIGGGASGMIAAITAATAGHQVTIVERQSRVGRKLLATGNGRCNLTNKNISVQNYHGSSPDFVHHSISQFSLQDTLDFFLNLGLLTTTEPSGRVYPISDQAGSVVDTLRFALDNLGVDLRLSTEITVLTKRDGIFIASSSEETLIADRVIVCCGGTAGGKLGGNSTGYTLLAGFGHHTTKLYPALVQIKTDQTYVRSLKGVRAEANVSVHVGKERIAQSRGEVQFTEYGISGPAVFEVSRSISTASCPVIVHLDLLPQFNMYQTEKIVSAHIATYQTQTIENLLTGTIHNRLGRTILRSVGFDLNAQVSSLKSRDGKKIATAIKDFRLQVTGTNGFDSAQVTAGGIMTDEFHADTLESKLVSGLYAAGEILDIDGDCGGYNLQWAWSSGHLAGQLN